MTHPNQELVDRVRRRLIADATEPTSENVAAALRLECGLVDGSLVLDVIDQLRSDSRGFGPLDPVMALPGVTDVLVKYGSGMLAALGVLAVLRSALPRLGVDTAPGGRP